MRHRQAGRQASSDRETEMYRQGENEGEGHPGHSPYLCSHPDKSVGTRSHSVNKLPSLRARRVSAIFSGR